MSTGLKRLNEQSYSPGLNGNVMNPLVNIPFKRQDDEVALSGVQSFTRASTGTYIDALDGLIKTAAIDTPRFEKMPDGGVGVLLEGASTNTCPQSGSSSGWSIVSATATDNFGTSPLGTNTSVQMVCTNATYNLYRSFSVPADGDIWTASIWLKGVAGESGSINQNIGTSSNFTFTGDWQRITNTVTFDGVRARQLVVHTLQANTTFEWWGAQSENLPFATSYIPTTTAVVTRGGDILKFNKSGNMKSGAEETWLADVSVLGTQAYPYYGMVAYASGGGYYYEFVRILNGVQRSHYGITAVDAANHAVPCINTVVRYGLTISKSNNEYTAYANGVLRATDTVTSDMAIVTSANPTVGLGFNRFFGHIRNFRIYDRALTTAEVLVA